MARPREFDVDEVLSAAMERFWEHGYAATSMADLMDATGLQKGSLYKAFGSKHELYTEALARYEAQNYATMKAILEAEESPREGLRRWLRHVVQTCSGQGTKRGCFGVNSLVELGPHDAAVAARLRKHFAGVEKLLAETIARAQERGELRADRSPAELAEALFLFAKGVIASSKGGHPRARLQRSADLFLDTLT